MKILGKSFSKFLSLCKIFGTAILLLLGNPSEGIDLPGNSIVFSNVDVSSPVVADLNHGNNPMPFAMDETASLFSFPISAPPPAPDNVTVCEGGNATFTVTGGTEWQWQISTDNGLIWTDITGKTSSSLTLNGVTFLMNDNQYRCQINSSPSASATLTVNPLPVAAGSISGSATVCQGQNPDVKYSVQPFTNATLGYVWTAPPGTTIISGQGSISIIVDYSATATDGLITVYGTNLCGDGQSLSLPVSVSLLPLPASTIVGTSPVCRGNSGVIYQVPIIEKATSYKWILPTGATIVGNETGNSITVNFSATASSGMITVRGENSCGEGDVSLPFIVTVNELPYAAEPITGLLTVCQDDNDVTYSIPTISNATGYNWTIPAGATFVGGTNNNTITVDFSSSAVSGIVTVRGTNVCGLGSISAPFAVTVDPLPSAAGAISGLATVCQGQFSDEMYSVQPITNATDYEWVVPSGASIISGQHTQSIIVHYSVTAISGLITVYGKNLCSDGQSTSLPVIVDILPLPASTIVGTSPVCQGQTGVTYSVPIIGNATSYIWSLPTGASIVSGANTNIITVNFSATASGGSIIVQGENSCGVGNVSASYTVTVNNLPSAAGAINGPSAVCQGNTTITYSILPILNANGYNWIIPSGAMIVSGTNTTSITVDFSATAISGDIMVQGTNACGAGPISAPFAVSVELLPSSAGTITGLATLCKGRNGVMYSVLPVTNATSYVWAVPSGASIISGQGTMSIIVDYSITAISESVTVYGTNTCGNGQSSFLPVTMDMLPLPASTIVGTSPVCQGQNGVTYSVPIIGIATSYVWTLPPGATIISGANTNIITVNFSATASSGTITVRGENPCGVGDVSLPFTVTVNDIPSVGFKIEENYDDVQGQIHLINESSPDATSFEWDFGNGFTSTDKEPTISYSDDGIYNIKLISYNSFLCTDTLVKLYELMFKGLYVPNAFSPIPPNSTNVPELFNLFKPVGKNIETYLVEVYDSWGKLLWSSTKLDPVDGSPLDGWDGTSPNGNLLPQDVYVWRIEAVFKDGTAWNSNNADDHTNIPEKTYGTVTLLR